MATDHVLPPADWLHATLAMAHLSEARLAHLRNCPACRLAWYRAGAFRAGCIDPRIGVQVLASLGATQLPAEVRDHLLRCVSCRLLVLDASRAMASDHATP